MIKKTDREMTMMRKEVMRKHEWSECRKRKKLSLSLFSLIFSLIFSSLLCRQRVSLLTRVYRKKCAKNISPLSDTLSSSSVQVTIYFVPASFFSLFSLFREREFSGRNSFSLKLRFRNSFSFIPSSAE